MYVQYKILDSDGNTVVGDTALTTSGTVTYSTSCMDNFPYLDVNSNGKAHITWCDYRTGDYEIYYTNYQGPPCMPAAAPTLTSIGLIALVGLLSIIAAMSMIRKK